MEKFYFVLFMIICTGLNLRAQTVQKTTHGLRAEAGTSIIDIQYFSPSTVRIIKWPQGKDFKKESLSVVQQPQTVSFKMNQKGSLVILKSEQLKVELNLDNGKITFSNNKNQVLLNEKEAGASFTNFNDAGVQTLSVKQSFELETDETIYGLGILQNGKMSQREQSVYMVQNNTWDFVPFFQSVKGYGVFWDNYSPTTFKDTITETSFFSEVGEGIDYYFMYGGNADGVVTCMRELTGQVPMFPLWTYGYWQSKERYKTQDETVGVVRKYRELGVPLDGIIQDWQYWGNNYLWNAMEFLNPGFHDPKRMVDEIHGLNAHMIISIWSSFGPMTKQYRELNEKGMLMDFNTWPQSGSEKWPPNREYPSGVKVYDAYNPEARDIYWRYLKNGLFDLGIDGWWMDSTEPDHLDIKPKDIDQPTYLGSFRKIRNAYPLMSVGGVYNNQRAVTSDKRVFILTRSAFAGQQRYGANTWSGDVVASWETLHRQIPAGLNFSLCAIPHFNSDIGGFFLWDYKNDISNPDYRELYVRWLQFGTFSPMMRSHGEGAPREIFQFGQKGDRVYDAIEKYINLRYRMLPYIYSSSWDVSANQSSMIRALMMDFASDKNALDINDQYLFGKSILVCPVTKGMYSKNGKEDFSQTGKRTLYLPEGTDWIDFWTGEKHSGGQKIDKAVPIDIIPLFVKAGTILPIGPDVQYAEEKKWDQLEIRIYEGADGSFTLYEDENDSYNYEKGLFSTIHFKWDDKKKTLTIDECKGTFPGMLTERKFNILKVSKEHGLGDTRTVNFHQTVEYHGNKIQVKL